MLEAHTVVNRTFYISTDRNILTPAVTDGLVRSGLSLHIRILTVFFRLAYDLESQYMLGVPAASGDVVHSNQCDYI